MNEAEELVDEVLDGTVVEGGVMVVTIVVDEVDDTIIVEVDNLMVGEDVVKEMMIELFEELVATIEEDEVEEMVIVEGKVGEMEMVQDEELGATIQASVAGEKMVKKWSKTTSSQRDGAEGEMVGEGECLAIGVVVTTMSL